MEQYGVLGYNNRELLGESFIFAPGVANGTEGLTWSQFQGPLIALTALRQWDSNQMQIGVSATPLNSLGGSNLIQQSLRMYLEFTSGRALFGVMQEPPPFPPTPPGVATMSRTSTAVKVDANGSVIALPASLGFRLRFEHYSSNSLPFVAGDSFGCSYRVNVGYSYGSPKSFSSVYTDNMAVMAVNQYCLWAKPQFAKSVHFDISRTPTSSLGGYLNVVFIDSYSRSVKEVHITMPLNGDCPEIQWPSGAYYMIVDTFGLTIGAPATDIVIAPVNAIIL